MFSHLSHATVRSHVNFLDSTTTHILFVSLLYIYLYAMIQMISPIEARWASLLIICCKGQSFKMAQQWEAFIKVISWSKKCVSINHILCNGAKPKNGLIKHRLLQFSSFRTKTTRGVALPIYSLRFLLYSGFATIFISF